MATSALGTSTTVVTEICELPTPTSDAARAARPADRPRSRGLQLFQARLPPAKAMEVNTPIMLGMDGMDGMDGMACGFPGFVG